VIENSAALDNGKIGILVEGGAGTVIKGDQVCASGTAIAVRNGVTEAVLTGNDIRCEPRSGFSVGPDTPGIMISGNTVVSPRTAFLISDSGAVELDNNHITGATVFGVSARGLSSAVTGVGNVISGTGFRAVDARADASMPALSSTDDAGWAYHARVTFWSYLFYHPLAALWLSIAILLLSAWAWSNRRRLPGHPYPASTRWRNRAPYAASMYPAPVPAFAGAPSKAGAATDDVAVPDDMAVWESAWPDWSTATTDPLPARSEPEPPSGAARDVFSPSSREVDRQ